MGQEYCRCIFLQPICCMIALFWTTFHKVLEGTTLGMYSQSTRGPELFFLQVVKYLKKILNNVLQLIILLIFVGHMPKIRETEQE